MVSVTVVTGEDRLMIGEDDGTTHGLYTSQARQKVHMLLLKPGE
jgi:hypothetical protein